MFTLAAYFRLLTTEAARSAVSSAYRGPFSRALLLSYFNRVAASSMVHSQSIAIMRQVKSALLIWDGFRPVLPAHHRRSECNSAIASDVFASRVASGSRTEVRNLAKDA